VNNNADIAVITETWLHDDIDSNMIEIAEYMLFRLDRGGQLQGGVAVYVKSGIPCIHLSHLTQDNLEVMWLIYRPHTMPREIPHLLICAVYFPPKANSYEMIDYLISSLDTVTHSHPCAGILLLGDFNQLPDAQLKSFPLQQIVTSTSATRGTSCFLLVSNTSNIAIARGQSLGSCNDLVATGNQPTSTSQVS